MSEQWRTIYEFPDYDVSNHGRVRSRRRGRVRILKANAARYGRVVLCRGGEQKHYSVHRLVLTAFVGPCPTGQEASHLDGDLHNNRVSNLTWETSRVNNHRKVEHGTQAFGEQTNSVKLTPDQVVVIRAESGTVREIAARHGVTNSHISRIRQRKVWSHV